MGLDESSARSTPNSAKLGNGRQRSDRVSAKRAIRSNQVEFSGFHAMESCGNVLLFLVVAMRC
jgi:hypothetical protein